jgi:hypothetical protein
MQVGDLVKTIDGWIGMGQLTGMIIEVEPATNHALVLLTKNFANQKSYWFPIRKLEAVCK